MLIEQERQLIVRVFAQGPAVMFEEGFSEAEFRKFFQRTDVQAQFALLQREMDFAGELDQRTKWTSRRQMARLQPHAVAVIAKALAGPQYLTKKTEQGITAIQVDATGKPIMTAAEITPTQIRAAEIILDALGVPYARAKNDSASQGATRKMDSLFKADDDTALVIATDPLHKEEHEHALSRERVRNVIALLATEVPKLHENLNEGLGVVKNVKVAKVKKKRKVRRANTEAKAKG